MSGVACIENELIDEVKTFLATGENRGFELDPESQPRNEKSGGQIASAILEATARGDVAALGRLLTRCNSSDVNYPDADSATRLTPLIAAAKAGNDTVVDVLITCRHVDVNARGGASHSTFPLLEAARQGRTSIVAKLLAVRGIDVNQRGLGEEPLSSSPLLAAAARGHAATVQQLISAEGIDVNAAGSHAKTPIRIAAGAGHRGVVKALLEAEGIDVNLPDLEGRTPLFAASQAGHKDIVDMLLKVKGIKAHQTDLQTRATPLFAAAAAGHAPVVHSLLQIAKADPNKADVEGRQPLFAAASAGHRDCVLALLCTRGVRPNEAGPDGATALTAAASGGHLDTVKALLSVRGIFPNKADDKGVSPIWAAAQGGHAEVVNLLLRAPWINAGRKGPSGATALQVAASMGHKTIVDILLKGELGSALVNVPDVYGRTPLFAAASSGHEATVEAILAHPQVEVNQRDNSVWGPLHTAANAGHSSVLRALLRHPCTDLNMQDLNNMTACNVACAAGHKACVEILKHGKQIDMASREPDVKYAKEVQPEDTALSFDVGGDDLQSDGVTEGSRADDSYINIEEGKSDQDLMPLSIDEPMEPATGDSLKGVVSASGVMPLPGPLRQPGTSCRRVSGRPGSASVACVGALRRQTPSGNLISSRALATTASSHAQPVEHLAQSIRPDTAHPSGQGRGTQRRLELLRQSRTLPTYASSLVVEIDDDVGGNDRGSRRPQDDSPYEDARRRLMDRQRSGYIRHALPRILNEAVLVNMKVSGESLLRE